jgi:hypothetical protein
MINLNWRKYVNSNHKGISTYLNYNGNVLYPSIIDKIKTSHDKKLPYCILFHFKYNEDMICLVRKEDYSKVLDEVLKWYVKTEDFKKCSQIKTLINSIDSKKTKKRKLTKSF